MKKGTMLHGCSTRYAAQMDCIRTVAAALGLVVYFPDYHGKPGDANTVLLYTKENADHNLSVDKQQTQYSCLDEARMYGCNDERYIYRPYLWSFDNTDANMLHTYDFANHGTLDLRGGQWRDRIEGSIALAYYKHELKEFIKNCGGWENVTDDDAYTVNGFTRNIITAFNAAYGSCYLVKLRVPCGADDSIPPFTEYTRGENIGPFDCNYVIKKMDKKLEDLILQWRAEEREQIIGSCTIGLDIMHRVVQIGGEKTLWK